MQPEQRSRDDDWVTNLESRCTKPGRKLEGSGKNASNRKSTFIFSKYCGEEPDNPSDNKKANQNMTFKKIVHCPPSPVDIRSHLPVYIRDEDLSHKHDIENAGYWFKFV